MKHQIPRTEIKQMNGRQMKSSRTQHINNGKPLPHLLNPKKGAYGSKLRSHTRAVELQHHHLTEAAQEHLMAHHEAVIQLTNQWGSERRKSPPLLYCMKYTVICKIKTIDKHRLLLNPPKIIFFSWSISFHKIPELLEQKIYNLSWLFFIIK